ncbi:MAG: tRNA (N(6)-L-threonylcarbamoyladenosine(37)-C(2))-methylthiotransferase MtaB [Dehalococcoidia bacterium]
MKVLIETHGCKLNTADSQRMAKEFVEAGYEMAGRDDSPDVFVLNSCTVTHVADRKARQSLHSARRRFPSAVVVAAGCYPSHNLENVSRLEAVDLVVTNQDKPSLVQTVSRHLGPSFGQRWKGSAGPPSELLGRTRASVKIQEGCDQVCAYCIVPKVRGREKSIPERQIVQQVSDLARGGCPEVILTGTQLGSYGFDLENTCLSDMVVRILRETDVPRLRVSSLQPLEVTDDLLDLWSGIGRGRLCPHFHLPLQSGSDDVLKRMRRRYDAAAFLRTVERVRQAVPDCSVTTDIIAGFPGESDADQTATLDVVEQARFADAHVFPYSVRPGTTAAHFNVQVPSHVRSGRAAGIREITSRHAREHRMSFVGKTRPVLWEKVTAGVMTGLTDNYLRVRLTGSPSAATEGSIQDIVLTGIDRGVMLGEPLRS